MKSIDELIGKGLSLWVIVQLISLNLAWMLTLAVPMAVLVSTLMAFGSLSSNNEITIMKANGISLFRLMLPIVICSILLTYLMTIFNNQILPEANHKARVLLQDISKTKPTFFLKSGKFSDDVGGVKIFVRKTFENSNELEGIYIYDFSNQDYRNLVTAKKGNIGFTSDFKNIVMNLTEGEIHQINNRDIANRYRRVEFEKHRIVLDAAGFGFERSPDNAFIRGDREMSVEAMNAAIDSLKMNRKRSDETVLNSISSEISKFNKIKFKDTIIRKSQIKSDSLTDKKNYTNVGQDFYNYDTLFAISKNILSKKEQVKTQLKIDTQIEKQMDMYDVEIYKKYSIPFACLIFTMIGAPLGYRVKKGGFGIAAGLSLFFFLIYWASLIGGEKLADRGLVTPFLGMWLVNIVLGLFGLYLMFKSS